MKKCLSVALLIMSITACYSQEIELDLAKDKEQTLDFEPSEFKGIKLINAFPGKKYIVEVKHVPIEIAPIELEAGTLLGDTEDKCKPFRDTFKQFQTYLKDGDKEADLKTKMDALEELLKNGKDCTELPDLRTAFAELVTKTKRLIDKSGKVKRGFDLIIIVSRGSEIWKFKIEGEPIGAWRISYGFAVTSLYHQTEFFAKKNADPATDYKITKKSAFGKSDLDFTPAVFLSFIPANRVGRLWYASPVGGIGGDKTSPTFFLGGGAFYGENLGLTIGIAVKKLAHLKGIYNDGDVVSEALDFDQLHDKTYRGLFYISLNIRFKENPLKSDSD